MSLNQTLSHIRQCQTCQGKIPDEAKPIIQFSSTAKILLIGQAPGKVTNEVGKPFLDQSGKRLRQWLDISEADFYNNQLFNIMPMAFCYPGKNKSGSGDAPPPKICQQTWHQTLLEQMPNRQLTLLIGSYAREQYLPEYSNLIDAIQQTCVEDSNIMVLPHPSPRNNIWLKKNDWFETETLPVIRQRLMDILHV